MSQEAWAQNMPRIVARCWVDAEFKARLQADPVAVLQAEGLSLPQGVQLQVLEDTPTLCHLVLVQPPADVSDAELEALSGGYRVSHEITDAVTRTNVKHLDSAPAVSLDPMAVWRSYFRLR